jgi:heme-degrading monooxygenase HmoA
MDIIVQHSVSDYDTWKSAFDGHQSERARFGCRGHSVYRDPDHPNDVTIFMTWESRDRAQEFMESQSLREAMQKGGVTSEPKATWLEEQETSNYAETRAA